MQYLCITVIAEKYKKGEQHFENELAGTVEDEIAIRGVFNCASV